MENLFIILLSMAAFTLPLTVMCFLFESETGKKVICKLAEIEARVERRLR